VTNKPAKLVEDQSGVAMMTFHFRTLIARRSTMLSIFAAVCFFSAAESRAGVIVPWANEARSQNQPNDESVGTIDLALAGSSSSSSAQLPVSERNEKHDRDQNVRHGKTIAGLVETNGGASIPVSSSTGQAGSAPATLVDVPAVPVAAKSFTYLRERTPQLPQPPLGELMDPPKACA
jgi:hypothetical protein